MQPNSIPLSKICKQCNKEFVKKRSESAKYWKTKPFCSRLCKTTFFRGKSTWNKGMTIDREKYPTMGHFQKHTPEALEKITKANKENAKKHSKEFFRENQKKAIKVGLSRGSYKNNSAPSGDKNPSWLGEEASYNAKHRWIQKNWKKTGTCQKCGKVTKPFGRRKWGTEWHSIDRKYDREDRSLWLEVCIKCHRKLDKLWILEDMTEK